MKRPSIVLVAPTPPPVGGIARWTSLLLDENARDPRADIRLVNSRRRLAPTPDSPRIARIASGLFEMSLLILRLGVTVSRHRPQIVHLTTAGSLGFFRDLLAIWLARAFNAKSIVHLRFGRVPSLMTHPSVESRMLRAVVQAADYTIALDEASYTSLHGIARNIELIPNGIHLKNEEPIPEPTDKYVLFAGWLIPSKGVYELAAAWSQVHLPGWRLAVAGPAAPGVEDSLRKAVGGSRIEFLGVLAPDALHRVMQGCSIFVLPSHTEGFPNAVLEAMAASKPVVATPVGAIPEMLDGGAGVIVPVADPTQLAKAIKDLAHRPEIRERMGQVGLERVRSRYTFSSVCDRYGEVWRHLAGEAEKS